MRGEKGDPREWIVVHHDPRPGWSKEAYTKLDRFARNQRYKLYDDGRLSDVPNDVLEEHPILPAQGTAKAKQARGRLQKVLDTLV